MYTVISPKTGEAVAVKRFGRCKIVDPQGSPEVWKSLRVFLTSFSSDEPSVECAKSTKDEFNELRVY